MLSLMLWLPFFVVVIVVFVFVIFVFLSNRGVVFVVSIAHLHTDLSALKTVLCIMS